MWSLFAPGAINFGVTATGKSYSMHYFVCSLPRDAFKDTKAHIVAKWFLLVVPGNFALPACLISAVEIRMIGALSIA